MFLNSSLTSFRVEVGADQRSYRLPPTLRISSDRSKLKRDEILECGFATEFTLDCAIMYSGLRGIHIDSSWRNKTADKSPLTFVLTVDNHGHGVPSKSLACCS